MMGFLRDFNTSQSVIDIFEMLYVKLGRKLFEKIFPVILTDRGSEFSNPRMIEYTKDGILRTKVYYCDAGCPHQKGSIEVNHELIRRVLPKGVTFDNLTQENVDVMMNHIGTHDTERAITKIAGESCEYRDRTWQSCHSLSDEQKNNGIRLLKCAAALQYTLPGVPSVYYGDEAGMQGYKDPFNRGCYPWGNENTDLVEFYKELGSLRNSHSAFKDGVFIPVSYMLGCVAYRRRNADEDVMVIVNRNDHHISYCVPEEFENATLLMGNNITNREVSIGGYSFAILQKRI